MAAVSRVSIQRPRLRLRIGDVGGDAEREVVGGDAVARLGEAFCVIADDVVAQAAVAVLPGDPRPRGLLDIIERELGAEAVPSALETAAP